MPGEYPVVAFVARPSERLRRSREKFDPALRSKRNDDGSLSFTLPGGITELPGELNKNILVRRIYPVPHILRGEDVHFVLQAREQSGRGRRWFESVITGYDSQPIRPFRIKPSKPYRHSLVMFSGSKLGRVGLFFRQGKHILLIDRAKCNRRGNRVVVTREIILCNLVVPAPPEFPELPAHAQSWKAAVEAVYLRSQCTEPSCRQSHYSV